MSSIGGLTCLIIGIGEEYRDNNIIPIYRYTIEKRIK